MESTKKLIYQPTSVITSAIYLGRIAASKYKTQVSQFFNSTRCKRLETAGITIHTTPHKKGIITASRTAPSVTSMWLELVTLLLRSKTLWHSE